MLTLPLAMVMTTDINGGSHGWLVVQMNTQLYGAVCDTWRPQTSVKHLCHSSRDKDVFPERWTSPSDVGNSVTITSREQLLRCLQQLHK